MKMIISVLILSFFSGTSLYAQNIEGVAFYKSFHSLNKEKDTVSRSGAEEKLRDDLMKQIQSQLQKEFKLTFKGAESVYSEETKLAIPKPAPTGGITITIGQSNDVDYRNLKDSTYVRETEIQNKLFLIEDKLKKIDWKLEKETKNIGQYTCFKATFTRQEQTEKYDYKKNEPYEAEDTVVTTVWYAPQIPLSHGPDEYWGLPGLILEVSEGERSLLCYKVVLNPKDIIEFKIPSKGKRVDQSEYDRIAKKKQAEMWKKMKGFERNTPRTD